MIENRVMRQGTYKFENRDCMDKLKKYLRNPKNRKKLQKLLEHSLDEATETKKYYEEQTKLDYKKLDEPMTI